MQTSQDFMDVSQTTVRSVYTCERVTSSVWETVLWFGVPTSNRCHRSQYFGSQVYCPESVYACSHSPRRILLETANCLQLPNSMVSTIHATVFEDNNSALSLAVNQRITNRTKHLLIKWHWFWHHVKMDRNPDGPAEVQGISTDCQHSDYLTKALSRILFGNNCFKNQGW